MIQLHGVPDVCNMCKGEFGDRIYDAVTRYGPWAYMCNKCVDVYGMGKDHLGTGKGQVYERMHTSTGIDIWVKAGG